jgi:hypothetical protein
VFYTIVPPVLFMTHAHFKCNVIVVDSVVVSDTLISRLFVSTHVIVVGCPEGACVSPPSYESFHSFVNFKQAIKPLTHVLGFSVARQSGSVGCKYK